MSRQMLIERVYDACEFPQSDVHVYISVYYALSDALNMEAEDFKQFFPYLTCPTRYNSMLEYSKFTSQILEKSRLDILEEIAENIEYYANLEYDDGYDSY
jgi:hypothetical protein